MLRTVIFLQQEHFSSTLSTFFQRAYMHLLPLNFSSSDMMPCYDAMLCRIVHRVKRTRSTNIPYKKENDEEAPTGSIRRTAAFENPGYDSTGGLDIGSGGNYDDIAAVTFSPFEDFPDHTAATNQLYSAIGMTRISSSQDVSQNAEGGELAVKKITSDEKATQDHDAGALPKKEPLENEKAEQHHYATITINKNEESEENEPRYLTVLPSGREFANSEQVKVDLQENAEKSNGENGQTVLVLDANYNQDEDPEV